MANLDLHNLFSALGDPTRLAIVERLLREKECTAGQLAEPFSMSKPAISRHIKVLEETGLIERRVEKQWRVCSIRADALRTIGDWFEENRRFWEASLDRLETLMNERDAKNGALKREKKDG